MYNTSHHHGIVYFIANICVWLLVLLLWLTIIASPVI